MGTEAKYYIPEIEEIIYQLTNVGEIFIVNSSTETLSKIQTHPDIPNTLVQFIRMNDVEAGKEGIKYSINPELYRIKYLDSEDIENLGFVYNPALDREEKISFTKGNYCIDLYKEDKEVWVRKVIMPDFPPKVINLFVGKIKNLSELKQVLKMIGVH